MRVKSSVIYECGKLQAQLNTTGRKKMPRGKGTYGSKVGRPPKKSKKILTTQRSLTLLWLNLVAR
jgi:hypothetical protein